MQRGNITRYVHIHTSTSDYLLFTRFFPPLKLQCYWRATSFNDTPSLNATVRKRDIEHPGPFSLTSTIGNDKIC